MQLVGKDPQWQTLHAPACPREHINNSVIFCATAYSRAACAIDHPPVSTNGA